MKLQARNFVVRKPETIDITMFFKKFCIATRTTSEQSPLCSDVLLFLRNKRTSSARFLAPPFQIEPAALGFDLVFSFLRTFQSCIATRTKSE